MKKLWSLAGAPRWAPALATAGAQAFPEKPSPRSPRPFALGRLLSSGSGGPDSDEKRTVRAQRRRRTEPPASGQRERAEAPRREREGQPAGTATPRRESGQAAPPRTAATPRRAQGSASLPSLALGSLLSGGGRSRLLIIVGLFAILALCLCVILFILPGGDTGDVGVLFPPATSTSSTSGPVAQEEPTKAPLGPTAEPFIPPPPSTEGQTWLVMFYQDADDKILEQDIYVDLNEAERVGSSDRVQMVTQVDRYRAGYQGDGNWSSTKRFYVTQDQDLNRLGSQQMADLGEVNMSDGGTLVDFVTWAMETFPSDKYVLILSDHGMGWPGGWSDPDPGGRGDPSIPLSSALGDQLYLHELDDALAQIRAQTGLEEFELIGMDACLMGHLEVFSALAPHGRYAVASQETEPAVGWAYTAFLQALVQDPDMTGAELSQMIVESYIEEDQRIVDDDARAEMLSRGSPMGGFFGMLSGPTADQLAAQMSQNATLTAVDLAALPGLLDSVNDLAFVLQGIDQKIVARARTYALSFTSVFGKNVPPSYLDLGNFVQLLKRESNSAEVAAAVDRVMASISRAVIAEKHGPDKRGATGISIYFPNSQLYQSPVTGATSYTAVARRFADQSLWDDLLAFHYTGRRFEAAAGAVAVPEPSETVIAPGAGPITVSPITASSNTAAPGQPVLLSTDISGQNVGYVYLFVGFYDQASSSIFVADRDYLESAETREIDGVYYPDWGEGAFTMEFEWEPLMFGISDGVDTVVALLTPQIYGATYEEAVYAVEGIYSFADGGESRYARLYFRDGVLRQAFGFTGQNGTGSPREIIPQTGDRFTILERWLDLDQNGRVVQSAFQEGDTLTFRDQMLTWVELDAAAGDYLVGFVVEDLDGNAQQTYAQITVR